MAGLVELIRGEDMDVISFGNHELAKKAKLDNFQNGGDLYKVKTFREITKLEKNGLFLYESLPGTTVMNFRELDGGVEFLVEGDADAQITVGLKEDQEYEVFVDEVSTGTMNSGLGGKLNLSAKLENVGKANVRILEI
jgi:hypothetical protein